MPNITTSADGAYIGNGVREQSHKSSEHLDAKLAALALGALGPHE